MKANKRFFAMAAALALTACVAAPMSMTASAASITIDSTGKSVDASNHTFSAYQILTGTPETASNPSGFTGVASSVAWGSAITDDGAALMTALKTEAAKVTGSAFSADAKTAIGTLSTTPGSLSSAYQFSQVLASLTGASDTEALLAIINSQINVGTTATAGTGSADSSAHTYTIGSLADGYYFVKDTTSSLGDNDAYSKYILKVAGTTTLTIKTDAPSLDKMIWDNDANTTPTTTGAIPAAEEAKWVNVADNQIGDTVYYCIKTTVPDMTNYDTYKYVIRDSLSSGLTFTDAGNIDNIKYVPATGDAVELKSATGVTITVADDASTTEDTETFYISIDDLKSVSGVAATGGTIYTYYHATLNGNALTADSATNNTSMANTNTAWLTYSNNPNSSGSGDTTTSDTPKDIVYDYTFTHNAQKVDENSAPLSGATFKLCKDSSTDGMSLVELTFAQYKALVGTSDSTTEDPGNTRYFRPAVTGDLTTVTSFTSDTVSSGGVDTVRNKFKFVGLDDVHQYKVYETAAPSNYTKQDAPAVLVVSPGYTTNSLNAVNRTVDSATGGMATIVNYKGSSLPTTGGIGTRIFVLGGGATAALAGIYLVSRRRTKEEMND